MDSQPERFRDFGQRVEVRPCHCVTAAATLAFAHLVAVEGAWLTITCTGRRSACAPASNDPLRRDSATQTCNPSWNETET